mmetsp:Transcript_57601/g.122495  ORF Transcript_57601/g.122495 Transcript_57601/m.122495 type:complete len:90 (-) Transcript_57601:997-1266(-)
MPVLASEQHQKLLQTRRSLVASWGPTALHVALPVALRQVAHFRRAYYTTPAVDADPRHPLHQKHVQPPMLRILRRPLRQKESPPNHVST